jgi:hypothetical protein
MLGVWPLRGRLYLSGCFVAFATLQLTGCATRSKPAQRPPPRIVTLRGSAFDSLASTPLRGARVTLIASDTVVATTDTNGVFEVSLQSGMWESVVAHPRYDSLRIVVPAHPLEVPPEASVAVDVWTPSRRVITRLLCGNESRSDDVALVGSVRDASTHTALPSAFVVAKWMNLKLKVGGFTRSTETRVVQTGPDGWYVSCGVPANGTVMSWAEHAGAVSGVIPLTLEDAPVRLDLSVDATALSSGGPIDLDPDSSGGLFPIASGKSRYRVVVRDVGGRPVSNARVRILGQHTVLTNDAGAVTLDSIAGGTQTIEIMAIGYQPHRRTVDITPGRVPADTFMLASLGTILDTIRVTAGRDLSGFDRRRRAGAGQFITAADVERENPQRTTALLKTRDGMRFTFDRAGVPYIEVTTQSSPCRPLFLLDGFPARGGPPPAMGHATLDWLVHPDEIGGVEIYTNSGKTPPELARWGPGACATIAIWTRHALGLPKASAQQPAP